MNLRFIVISLLCLILVLEVNCDNKGGTKGGSQGTKGNSNAPPPPSKGGIKGGSTKGDRPPTKGGDDKPQGPVKGSPQRPPEKRPQPPQQQEEEPQQEEQQQQQQQQEEEPQQEEQQQQQQQEEEPQQEEQQQQQQQEEEPQQEEQQQQQQQEEEPQQEEQQKEQQQQQEEEPQQEEQQKEQQQHEEPEPPRKGGRQPTKGESKGESKQSSFYNRPNRIDILRLKEQFGQPQQQRRPLFSPQYGSSMHIPRHSMAMIQQEAPQQTRVMPPTQPLIPESQPQAMIQLHPQAYVHQDSLFQKQFPLSQQQQEIQPQSFVQAWTSPKVQPAQQHQMYLQNVRQVPNIYAHADAGWE